MVYINGGVREAHGGPIRTKKALKDAVNANPDMVEFYSTSIHGPQLNGPVTNLISTPDVTLSVCGPNPYADRRWYANITVKDGKLRVS